ncbi:MAG: hypothetical protein HHAS10_00980 [Candidatus Altimarinota bacterium]
MNLENLKTLIEKGIEGSGKKQIAIFSKNKKNRTYFRQATTETVK